MERIEKLRAFLKDSPQDCFLKHALALEYIKSNDDAQAEILFFSIIAQDPSYVGTYYHLGKLLERKNMQEAALNIYAKGMEAAKKASDDQAYRELRAVWEELAL